MVKPEHIKICDECGEPIDKRGYKQHKGQKKCKWTAAKKKYRKIDWKKESNQAIIRWLEKNKPKEIKEDYVGHDTYHHKSNLRLGHWASLKAIREAEKHVLRGYTTKQSRDIIDTHKGHVFVKFDDEIVVYELLDKSKNNRKVKARVPMKNRIYDLNGRLLGKRKSLSRIDNLHLKEELQDIKVAHKL